MKIISGGTNKEYSFISRSNHAKYAGMYNYDYEYHEMSEDQSSWPKLDVLLKELRNGHDLLWLDDDAIFTCPCPIPTFEQPIAFSYDVNGPCAGVLALKNHELSFSLLHACYSIKERCLENPWGDQAAFHYFLSLYPYSENVFYFKDVQFDYTLHENYNGSKLPKWKPENWILHAAGMAVESDRVKILTERNTL